jgi:hypothetical protein
MRAPGLALLVPALLLAGCSSGSDGGRDPAPRRTTTTTAESSTTTTSTTAFDGTTGEQSAPLTRDDTALLRDVTVGAEGGHDEVAFVFDGKGFPQVQLAYVEAAIADASGERIRVEGDAILRVRLEPAATEDLRGERPVPSYTGPDRVRGDTSSVTEVVKGGSFEGVLTFFIGVRSKVPYRFSATGDRLVLALASSPS